MSNEELVSLDLETLREVANAATPGPWEAYDGNEGMDPAYAPMWCVANDEFHNPSNGDDEDWIAVEIHVGDKGDAHFIETFDPPTALALLDRVDKLTESNRKLANQIVGYGDRVQESVRSIQADAWQAGYEIGGHDYMMAEDSGTGLSACRANPYRTEPTTNH